MINVEFERSEKGVRFACWGSTENAKISAASAILCRALFDRLEAMEKLDVVELKDARSAPGDVRFFASPLCPEDANILTHYVGFAKAGFRALKTEFPDEISVSVKREEGT